jgi:hypothetical protein
MATSTEAMILQALIERLEALTFTPPLPIAMPGVAFPESGATPENYLRADIMFNQTWQITLGDDPQQKRGIFQVSVVWKKGVGLIKPLDAAGAVINHFKNLDLWAGETRITIDREPWAASPLQEPDRVSIPVSISWHAFEPEV